MSNTVRSLGWSSDAMKPDYSSTTRVTIWVLLGITLSIFIARQIVKAVIFNKLGLDDVFMLIASISATGLAVSIVLLTSNGLGAAATQPKENDVVFMRTYYASQILYITGVWFAKLSILVLLHTIVTVHQSKRRIILGSATFVCAWGIASTLAIAFQCHVPQPWNTSTLQCFNTEAFWMTFSIVDVSTELFIIAMPIYIVSCLRVRTTRKVGFVACFLPRILVMMLSVARSIRLDHMSKSSDEKYLLWLPCILMQAHVALSFFTASILYMVPFFKSLEASLRRTYLSKSKDSILDERNCRAPRSLWYRRRQKPETVKSWDSTVVDESYYERLPQKSPYISTPKPLSPLTPPQYNSPQDFSDWNQSYVQGDHGLCIRIPGCSTESPRIEISGPQTGSSTASSPSCASPMASMTTRSVTPARKALTAPSKSYSPYAASVSSCYSSRPPSPPSPAVARFSLFPQQTTQHRRLSSRESIELVRSSISNGESSKQKTEPTRFPIVLSPYSKTAMTDHTATKTPAPSPKATKTHRPKLSPPITNLAPPQLRPESLQATTSPMGTAINTYFQDSRRSIMGSGSKIDRDSLQQFPKLYDTRNSPRLVVRDLH